jgi:hypothetical protein
VEAKLLLNVLLEENDLMIQKLEKEQLLLQMQENENIKTEADLKLLRNFII